MATLARSVALTIVLVGAALLGPAVAAPPTAARAFAAAHSSCTITGCADARTARSGWQSLGFPTSRGWYHWSDGEYNFAGGQYNNYEGQLPSGATYYEYDVYPRPYGAHRDAYRIVVNRSTGTTWYSPDHYADFYKL
ncbi:ribonuclease N [Planosporangium thailandense]|uniref:Ribonuclease N n=2 Tax=Planosporangium thailandense TaxID=765197 RepID=A0ABX0Y2K7_9ACTN|nr:ribonuclease domain-containing protein [Planosporangium thailandense]NJC72568.1 ribonuclease N [Planosporangium thailandense]